MAEEKKIAKENASQTLFTRDSYNQTIAEYDTTITELRGDIRVLEDDKTERDLKILSLDKEKNSWKARAEKAEKLLNDGKPLEGGKSYEQLKKETFEERIDRKWKIGK